MNAGAHRRWDRETAWVAGLASCASVVSFLVYFRHGELLLFGDAEGHINIARRVFDSRSPGPLQLGTVWLPLPHLLLMPFLISDWAWRTAVGGSIPSMIAYGFSAIGIFRLVRASSSKKFAAWFAVLILAGNPSLIYLQVTATTDGSPWLWLPWQCLSSPSAPATPPTPRPYKSPSYASYSSVPPDPFSGSPTTQPFTGIPSSSPTAHTPRK